VTTPVTEVVWVVGASASSVPVPIFSIEVGVGESEAGLLDGEGDGLTARRLIATVTLQGGTYLPYSLAVTGIVVYPFLSNLAT
jgi:hypothetical protein